MPKQIPTCQRDCQVLDKNISHITSLFKFSFFLPSSGCRAAACRARLCEVGLRRQAKPNWPSRDGRDTLSHNERRTRDEAQRATDGTHQAPEAYYTYLGYDCCCFASTSNLLITMFSQVGTWRFHKGQMRWTHQAPEAYYT